MVLVDTSVWIDFLRRGAGQLTALLESGEVLCHPFIIGELACGHLSPRKEVLDRLSLLPTAQVIRHPETLGFIETHRIFDLGLGFIDIHLLASASLHGATLWSRDKALRKSAEKMGIGFREL
jgi:predicted nucleic acid-binding protein